MSDFDPEKTNRSLAQDMHALLGIRRGTTLADKLRAAGRLVPKAEREAGRTLVKTEELWKNPKLRRQIDVETYLTSEHRLRTWLKTVDLADRRKGMILGILAALAFNFLVIATAIIVWMAWTGRV